MIHAKDARRRALDARRERFYQTIENRVQSAIDRGLMNTIADFDAMGPNQSVITDAHFNAVLKDFTSNGYAVEITQYPNFGVRVAISWE